MLDWLQSDENTIWWIASASIMTFLAFLIVVPLLAVRIPSDYFAHGRLHRKLWADLPIMVRMVLLVGKNLFGCVFIVAGIIMIVLPGQGILTIVIGIMLLDFPGKYRLVRWIVARRQVLRTINWLRRRAGRTPLYLEG
ncbi:MAG: PGPGW domain-containing protein [Proteobacteria bacterium]|nr:PGPGW domain-containing protein [Pseudomonadota bacterium]